MSERVETPQEKEKRINRKIWLAISPVFLFVAWGIFFSENKPIDYCTKSNAYDAAKRIVANHLKSPSSAKFAREGVDQVSIDDLGGCRYRVAGHVDSQNAFGAMLRTNFYITVKRNNEEKTWTGSGISLF
ncbi:hypothetical protein M2318_004845 [Metapseudomonas resinovorans]|uniref:hypothetical protein n=1 Tax=Metapseudomonas resinovorans TaxID=53412 RepID=UPI003D198503